MLSIGIRLESILVSTIIRTRRCFSMVFSSCSLDLGCGLLRPKKGGEGEGLDVNTQKSMGWNPVTPGFKTWQFLDRLGEISRV